MNSFRKECLPICSVGSLLYLPFSSPESFPPYLFLSLLSFALSPPLLSMIAQVFKCLHRLTVWTRPSYKHHAFLFCSWWSSLSKCVMEVQGIQMSHKKGMSCKSRPFSPPSRQTNHLMTSLGAGSRRHIQILQHCGSGCWMKYSYFMFENEMHCRTYLIVQLCKDKCYCIHDHS